jgi:thiol-disulfide isomerase/thioredoxin
MFNNLLKLSLAAVFTLTLILSSTLATTAQEKDSVVVVYASWSVVSRDLRPVAKQIATDFQFPYMEYDVDASSTQNDLRDLQLNVPTHTPFVVVLKNGNVVFKKAYPNSTPDLLKQDLSGVLAQYK